MRGGGQLQREDRERIVKNKGGRPKKIKEPKSEKRKKHQRMTPEVIGKIKEQITKGESPGIIAEEFGVNVTAIYQLRSRMKAEKTSDTFMGKSEDEGGEENI